MKIAITDRNNEIKDLNYRKNGLDITEDLVGFGPMQERCDEMEEEIDDQDAIEDMKEQCGNTDLEDSIRQYKYLLEEYTENKKGE